MTNFKGQAWKQRLGYAKREREKRPNQYLMTWPNLIPKSNPTRPDPALNITYKDTIDALSLNLTMLTMLY